MASIILPGNTSPSRVMSGDHFCAGSYYDAAGTMPNNGALSTSISNNNGIYNIPAGYTTGGTVTAAITNLVAGNVKAGVSVGGVAGTFTSDATITAAQILSGYVGYSNGSAITGTMTNYSSSSGLNGFRTGANDIQYVIVHPENSAYGNFRVKGSPSGYVTSSTEMSFDVYGLIPSNIKAGVYIGNPSHNNTGSTQMYGTFTSDANAGAGDMVSGATAYVNGNKITGNRPDQGTNGYPVAVSTGVSGNNLYFRIPTGMYRNPSFTGYVEVNATDNNWIESNIKSGVSIWGKTGTYTQNTKTAKGSGTPSGSYTFYADSGASYTKPYLQVSGLDFTPRAILITGFSTFDQSAYISSGINTYDANNCHVKRTDGNFGPIPIKLTASEVYYGGFIMPVWAGGSTVYWSAME
jgi:hypothetical protein